MEWGEYDYTNKNTFMFNCGLSEGRKEEIIEFVNNLTPNEQQMLSEIIGDILNNEAFNNAGACQ
jgi:hypothetical protein